MARKVTKKKTVAKKKVKRFTQSELKDAAKQLGARGGRATARKKKAMKIGSKRNKWQG